jgi:hypothetical protein
LCGNRQLLAVERDRHVGEVVQGCFDCLLLACRIADRRSIVNLMPARHSSVKPAAAYSACHEDLFMG